MSTVDSDANFNRLQIRRLIPASPERVFSAWTDPEQLKNWWGPKGVTCVSAEIELKIGGRYRIANELPDGKILFISGKFDVIERPHRLRYTWIVENEDPRVEQVSVRFQAHEIGTELTLTHEQIPTMDLREEHQQGWFGCMDGLERYLTEQTSCSEPN